MADLQLDSKSSISAFLIGCISHILDIPQQSIDVGQSFASLGGDSIDAVALVSASKRVGVDLNVSTVLLSKSVQDLANAASSNKAQELQRIRRPSLRRRITCEKCFQELVPANPVSQKRKFTTSSRDDDDGAPERESKRVNVKGVLVAQEDESLTEMQSLLLQSCDNEGTSNVITYSETYKLSHLAEVKAAWKQTVTQEPLLQRRMIVNPETSAIQFRDDTGLQWDEVETDSYEEYQYQLRVEPDPMIADTRFKIIKLDRGLHADGIVTIVWQAHHALTDGYAISLIYSNFQKVLNQKPISPSYPFSVITRQLKMMQEKRANEAQSFWKIRKPLFQSADSTLRLPRPISNARRTVTSVRKVIVHSLATELNAVAYRLDCTLASMYVAAWSIVLSRYLCSDCVSFGVVTSGRALPIVGVESTVGPLINTLPLCVRLRQDYPLSSIIKYVFEELALLNEMAFSQASDGFERSFSSAIAMQFDMEPPIDSAIRPIERAELSISPDVPLSICIGKTGEIQFFYRYGTFRESDIMLIGKHFERTLKHMLDESITVGKCLDDFLTNECLQSLNRATNSQASTSRKGFRNDTLVSLFKQSAVQHAQYTAIEKEGVKVSYASFNVAVIHVASQLHKLVKPGDAVCILADRSINWVIGIFAVLSIGGVYVPLNPASRSDAREANFRECGGRAFLAPHDSQIRHCPTACHFNFSVESMLSQTSNASHTSLNEDNVKPGSPAYICFTSGSTGHPKAVVCTHEGLVAFQSQLEVRLMAQPGIRISQIMSPVFDGSIHEIFSALNYGATLVLARSTGNPVEHLSDVDSAIMTPSLAAVIDAAAYPNLKYVYLVGETVPQGVCDAWAPRRQLYNMYGPTEATCGATISRLVSNRSVTIGRPNPSSRVYVLDHNQRQTPPGVTGEIYLAGVQVSQGFMGRPEETHARFLRDTVHPKFGEMMYRTGDFGYWSSTGEIIYIGRRDRQIKLRGFRLDLNNLESRIAKAIPEASGAAVTHKQGQLIAMIRPSSLSHEEIRCRLSGSLEPQFVPRQIIIVDEFPLSTAGKVDYAKIADHAPIEITQESSELTTRTEILLCKIWEEILVITDTEIVGALSNFSSLGGHSIAQLVLIGRLEKIFQCHLDKRAVLDLLALGTLRDLATLIDMQPLTPQTLSPESESASSNKDDLHALVSNVEAQWWYLYQRADQTSQFNVSLAWKIPSGKVDVEHLTKAWNTVLARHAIFRSRYVMRASKLERVQTVCAPTVTRVDSFDIKRECDRPFDMEKEFLIRVMISPDRILVCASHIILDLTAVRIVLTEVSEVYDGKTFTHAPKPYEVSLKHNTTISSQATAFWKKNLLDIIPARRDRLKVDSSRSSQGSSLLFRFGPDALKELESIARRHHTTKHQVALAAVFETLATCHSSQHPGSDSLIVGAPWNNRNSSNHDIVGLFLEILPVVLHCPNAVSSSPDTLLQTVRQSSQDSLAHAMPWSDLCHLVNIHHDTAAQHDRTATFNSDPENQNFHANLSTPMLLDAMVTLHDYDKSSNSTSISSPHSSLAGIDSTINHNGLLPLLTWSSGAKFRIMFEFSACVNGELILRVEYNESVYERARALQLANRVCAVLGKFGGNSFTATGAGKEDGESWLVDQADVLFGKPLS